MSDATAAIRRAVHDGSSRDEFTRIARAFDRLTVEETAQMLTFAAKHVEVWPAEVRVAPESWWYRIARGEDVPGFRFVRGLEVEDGPADLAHAIAHSAATRQFLHLRIRRTAIGDRGAGDLAQSDRLVQLESLALVDASIGPAGVRALVQGKLRPLRELDLSGNALSREALEGVLLLVQHGGALAVARCGLGVEAARRLAASDRSERLSSLDLSENEIGDAGTGALCASGWLAHLSELALASNGLTARSARALAGAPWIRGLRRLDLSDNALGEEGFSLLRPELGSIAELGIAGIGIGAESLGELLEQTQMIDLDASQNQIAALPSSRSLRRLTMRDVGFDPASIGSLVNAPLESLDLSDNTMSLSALAVLAGSFQLEHLDLSRTGLGDAGLSLIANARAMSTLRSLSLRNDGITPDGLSALLASERVIRLASIDLSDNPLGPEGARRLAESDLIARLTRIHARNCGFTQEWIDTLRRKNENCRC